MHKVESVIPWLNDALVFFTVSLQLCQQLKDKVGIWGQDRAGPHPEEASQSTGHSAPSLGWGWGCPFQPPVPPVVSGCGKLQRRVGKKLTDPASNYWHKQDRWCMKAGTPQIIVWPLEAIQDPLHPP